MAQYGCVQRGARLAMTPMIPSHSTSSFLIITALSAMLAAPAVARQTAAGERPELLSRLVACRQVPDSTARLACYDAAAVALDFAERQGEVVVMDRSQVSAARRQLFGFDLPAMPGLFDRGARPERIDAVETTLARAVLMGEGKWVFTLADGSVWRQIDSERVTFLNRPGETVRVRRASLGSYQLVVGHSRAVRVRRQ